MEKIKCPSCKKEYLEKLNRCSNCNFPFNGTEKEKAIHIGQFINKKGILVDSADSIKKSQIILYAIAVFNLIFLVVNALLSNYIRLDLLLSALFLLVLFLCAYNMKRNPLVLLVIPLVMIIGIQVFNYLIDPRSLLNGIVLKVLIIGSLIYSIYLVKNAEGFKKTYGIDE